MSLQISSPVLLPGMILVSSWGYDQTNIDFYQVISIKGKWATIQQMESISQSEPGGFMTTKEMPGAIIPGAPKLRRMIKGLYLKINSYACAKPWQGKPEFASHYA